MRIRDEAYFHTAAQVTDHTRDALEIADELGLEGADRAALLPMLVSLLSQKQVVMDAPTAATILQPGG